MAKKTTPMPFDPATATVADLTAFLAALRLERRWSWEQLGDAMGLHKNTVRQIVHVGVDPLDTTLHVIRRFVERVELTDAERQLVFQAIQRAVAS